MLTVSVDNLDNSGGILCLGAHCDDIEIGCGATLFNIAQRHPDIPIHILVFCSDERREKESRQSIGMLLGEKANVNLEFAGFRDGYLPYQAVVVKDFLSSCARKINPGIIFTHCRSDLHQDHKFVGDITYQIFRNHMIFEMEVPKYDGDLGRPNFYSPVSEFAAKSKISCLMNSYASQHCKDWFCEDTFLSLLKLRGIECRSETQLAEAFYVTKSVLR